MSDTVLSRIDGAVAVVSLNRPDRHNAFNDEMDARFFEVLAELRERDDVRCILWRGEGKSFSSGRDTKELGVRAKGESDLEFIEIGHRKTRLLWEMPVPIVAALKGWALGGGFERALLCDIRIASSDTRMGLPEVGHGVIPDSGGTARLFQMADHFRRGSVATRHRLARRGTRQARRGSARPRARDRPPVAARGEVLEGSLGVARDTRSGSVDARGEARPDGDLL